MEENRQMSERQRERERKVIVCDPHNLVLDSE